MATETAALVFDEINTRPKTSRATSTKPMRILQAVGGLNRGGLETWALHMAKNIDRERFEIDFLVDTTQDYAYNNEIRATGARVLPCQNYTHPPVYWDNLKAIYKEHGPYDVVHSHVHYFTGVILAMAALLKVPHRIAHVHPAVDLKPPSAGRSVYRTAMMAAIRKSATSVLACSETSLDAFLKTCRPKTQVRQVLYNGVDLSAYQRTVNREQVRAQLDLPANEFLITYVARFVPHKNHTQILRLAKRLQEMNVPVHFALVGSHGSSLEDIRKQVANQTNVSLLIGLPDVTDVLLSSDAFFFPSLEEGFGVVALEAAAAGLPVVASDFSTIREAVSPSQRAFMFPPDNDEIALQQLMRLIANEPLRQRLAEDGREWAQKFTIEQSVNSLMEFYESLRRPVAERA